VLDCSAQQCTNGAWCPRRTADGSREATADHILASCPLYHLSNGTLRLAALDDDTVDWLKRTALNIWWQYHPNQEKEAICLWLKTNKLV